MTHPEDQTGCRGNIYEMPGAIAFMMFYALLLAGCEAPTVQRCIMA